MRLEILFHETMNVVCWWKDSSFHLFQLAVSGFTAAIKRWRVHGGFLGSVQSFWSIANIDMANVILINSYSLLKLYCSLLSYTKLELPFTDSIFLFKNVAHIEFIFFYWFSSRMTRSSFVNNCDETRIPLLLWKKIFNKPTLEDMKDEMNVGQVKRNQRSEKL